MEFFICSEARWRTGASCFVRTLENEAAAFGSPRLILVVKILHVETFFHVGRSVLN